MSETHDQRSGLSRRQVLAGIGAAGAAGLLATGLADTAHASPARPSALPSAAPQAITPIAGLSYLQYDASGFFSYNEGGRDLSVGYGARSLVDPKYLRAPLVGIPVGSVLKQLNVIYRGTPIVWIDDRSDLLAPDYWAALFTTTSTPLSLTPTSYSYAIVIPIQHGHTYQLRVYAEPNNGITGVDSSIMGITVGYIPQPSGFMPYTGTTPRILDTRTGGGKVLAGDAGARTIDLGVVGAKAAVINLTAAETEAYGYFSVFPNNVTWPGNSSLNWTAANVTIANTVIAPLSPDGKIKLRAGESASHAIVDVQGFLY
jgi:hypothetical protein